MNKIKIGLLVVRRSKGISSKITVTRQLLQAGFKSHLRDKIKGTPEVDVKANAWGDYHLLSYVNRDVNVRVLDDAPRKLWVVVPELNASVIFGGYMALFQFMHFLQARGVQTGVLVLSPIDDNAKLLQSFVINPMVHGVLSTSDISAFGISRTIRLGAGDMLLAYNWTTSIVAAKMARFLQDPSYYYFAQEDERIFYPNDSYRFLAESLFHNTPKPRLICNSAKLLEHFRTEGLITADTEVGVFEQGLPEFPAPQTTELAQRSPRKFVFYGRPEDHAKRNLMSIALMAISRAVHDGAFAAEPWEFYMVGSARMGERIDLGPISITCLPNMDYNSYRTTMAGFDLGMSLMYAPHPSVPPFEMVRSGIITIVNTSQMRSAEWYRDISGNFEPAEATVEALAAAIGRAAARVGDVAARVACAQTYHPNSWEDSFCDLPSSLSHAIFRDLKEPVA